MKTYASIFILAAILSFLFTPLVRRFALRRGLLDHPDRERRTHRQPVPRLGGVAIYSSFAIALVSLLLVHNALTLTFQAHVGDVLKLLLPGTLIFLLGLYDDLRGANARIKFSFQIAASLLLYAFGFRITQIWNPFGGIIDLGLWGMPLTVLWLVGICNAFNLIDGLDGLSAGVALFALLTVSIAALVYGHPMVVLLAMALAGGTLGFLRYNLAPAQIFMGDSGSLFLGFMLAALSIQGSQKSATVVAVAIPIVSFGLPIVDTFWAIVRRLLGQRPIFTGDHEHIHHMMLKRGLTTRQVVILLYGICALFALFSLLFLNPQGKIMGLALFAVGVCIFVGIQYLGYHEVYELTYALGKVIRQRRTFARNVQLRRTVSDLTEVNSWPEIIGVLTGLLEANDFDHVSLKLLHGAISPPTGHSVTPTAEWQCTATDQGVVWSWCPNGRGVPFDPARVWQLHLPLADHRGHVLGEIIFHRGIDRGPLPVDIDHLCTLLRPALTQAITRLSLQRLAHHKSHRSTRAKASSLSS